MVKKLFITSVLGFFGSLAAIASDVDQLISRFKAIQHALPHITQLFGTDNGTAQEVVLLKEVGKAVFKSDRITGVNNFGNPDAPIFIRFINRPNDKAGKEQLLAACKKVMDESIVPGYLMLIDRTIFDAAPAEIKELMLATAYTNIKEQEMVQHNILALPFFSGVGLLATGIATAYRGYKTKNLKATAITAGKGLAITVAVNTMLGLIMYLEYRLQKRDRLRSTLGGIAVLWHGKKI